MIKVYAYYNRDGWKVDCPKCGRPRYTNILENKYVCPVCHPLTLACNWDHTPNLPVRQAETVAARQAEEEYNIDFPQHAAEIEASIMTEPDINWRNWYPDQPEIKEKHKTASAYGQTLADIEYERTHHGERP